MGTKLKSEAWQYFDYNKEEGISVCKLCKQRMRTVRIANLNKHLQKFHDAKVEVWNYFDTVVGGEISVCKQCLKSIRNNRIKDLIQHLGEEHNIVLFQVKEGARKKQTVAKNKAETMDNVKSDSVNLTDEDTKEEMFNQLNNESVTQNVGTILPVQINHEHEIQSAQMHAVQTVLTEHNQSSNNIVIQGVTSFTSPQISQECPTKSVDQTMSEVNYIKIEESKITSMETGNEDISMDVFNHGTLVKDRPLLAIDINEKILVSAVWGLIIDDGLSPQIVGSKNMQALIRPICEYISDKEDKEFKMDEAETEKLLCAAANHLRYKFSHDLDWRLLSLKIDMDLNGPSNTFCVTTQFINDGKIESFALGLIDLMDNPDLTDEHIKHVLHKYNIDSNQIISICWDNTKPCFNKYVENSEYLKEIYNFENHPSIQFGDIRAERYIGSIAQLCLLDIFKNPDIFQLFSECRNLVKFIGNESNGIIELFNANNFSIPQLDSPWKWGSTYEMIYNLLQARSILKDGKYPNVQHVEEKLNTNNDIWPFVEAFCESLNFMQKSILRYYNEEMHVGDFYVQWLKIKLLTEKIATSSDVKNSYSTRISTILLDSINIRSNDILDKDSLKACLFLDPRLQHTLKEHEKTKAVKYLQKLWSHLKMYKADVVNAALEFQDQEVESNQYIDDEDACLNEFLSQDVRETSTKLSNLHKKIMELKLPFKSVNTDILKYWNKQKTLQPEIYELSAICFALPATQNYKVNRYSHIYKPNSMTNLSSFTRDNLVSIRLNSQLLNEELDQFRTFNAHP